MTNSRCPHDLTLNAKLAEMHWVLMTNLRREKPRSVPTPMSTTYYNHSSTGSKGSKDSGL